MKKHLLSTLFYFLLIHTLAGQSVKDPWAVKYAETITAGDLSEYLHVLASDSLEGRATGEPGQKKAAAYMAAKFKEFGVAPGAMLNNSPGYFQQFELVRKEWQEVYLKVNGEKKIFLDDFYAYGDVSFPEEIKAPVVFAGYGIDSEKYSDYPEALDVKDKLVIVMNGEPMAEGKSLVTGDSTMSSWAFDWRKKAGTAMAKGAKAVLMIVGKTDKEYTDRLALLKHHIAQPSLGFTYKQKPGSAFFVSLSLAAEMMGVTPDKLIRHLHHRSLTMVKPNKAGKKKAQNPVKLKPASVSLKCAVKATRLTTENVLGYIEGSDKKEEVIVLTAHYDHLGKEGDHIYYGADDDGSGTAALMEIAQAFAQAKKEGHGPRRSVLIMPVTAEEKGLMGSEYYSDHPVYPLKNTVANLNIDMIGRLDSMHKDNPDYVYLIGTNRLSTELHDVSEMANRTYTNLQLDYSFNSFNDPNRFYYRSDHYNFAKHNIPVIFYFNGVHEDYHKPTDTVDKIIFPKVAKITQLVFYTTWELANMEKRIEVNVKEK